MTGYDFAIAIADSETSPAYFGAAAAALRRKGHRVAFLVTTQAAMRALGGDADAYFVWAGFEPEVAVSDSTIAAHEDRYRLSSMADHIYPQATYSWSPPARDLVPRAIHLFRWVERFCDEHEVRAFVNNLGGELLRRTLARVGERRGLPCLMLEFVPLPGRLIFSFGEYGVRLPDPLPPADAAQQRRARVVRTALTAARKPFGDVSKLGLGISNFKRALEVSRGLGREPNPELSVARLTFERAQRLIRRPFGRAVYSSIRDERFLFFPLHLSNDSAITVRAPQFQRQEEIIRYLAERCTPHGYHLYVKPHIAARDSYSLGTMAAIARLPNVRLIDPTLNAHELVTRAAVIIVVSSTVGFEAIAHGRPVVCIGRPFYRGHGVTMDVDNLIDLGPMIRRAMSFVPPEPLVLRLFAALETASFEAEWADSSAANAEKVARAIEAATAQATSRKSMNASA